MSNHQIINSKNASELTHFIRELGGGSMKKALIKLINDSKMKEILAKENAKLKSSYRKSKGVIAILTSALIAESLYLLNRPKTGNMDKKDSENDNSEDTKVFKETIESMSEEEVEEAVIEALKNQND